MCVFKKDNIVYGSSITDPSGQATINFSAPLTSNGMAQLVVYGYNYLETTYDIEVIGIDEFTGTVENGISIYPIPAIRR